MALLEEIQLKCDAALIASRDYQTIADAVNVGRVRANPTAIGKGTIIGVLGMAAGNAFLDVIDTAADYRHVKDIIKASLFDVSLPVSQYGIDAMVPAVLTQIEANALKALGQVPDPVSASRIATAMTGGE